MTHHLQKQETENEFSIRNQDVILCSHVYIDINEYIVLISVTMYSA